VSGPVDPVEPPEPPEPDLTPAVPDAEPTEQFNVGGAAAQAMVEVLNTLQNDPEIAVAEVQGDPETPTLVVVEMTPERADRLKRELEGLAIVEPNLPLDPFF